MIEFPFQKWHSVEFGNILKPLIPVSIIGPKHELSLIMLLDSGADISLIPYSYGESIGVEFDLSSRSDVQGIGKDSIPYLLGQVMIRIENIDIPMRIGWSLDEEVPFILGRLDLFKALSVEFRESENKILLKRCGK